MGTTSKVFIVVAVVVVAIAVVIIALLASSLKRLQSYEVGIQYDTVAKYLSETPKDEGLHTGPPGYEFITYPSVYKTLTYPTIKCLNKDGVTINLDIAYQYKVRASSLRQTIMQFKDHDGYKKILLFAGTSAIHETCSLFNTSQFQAERGAFQELLRNKLRASYENLQCDITDLQVNNIARPYAYESAVRKKEGAKHNIGVAKNERPRLITQAETQKKEAETQANIIIDKANSNARIVENLALKEAEAILDQYKQESSVYKKVVDSSGLNLNQDGFISYMGVRAIASAKNPVHIGMKGPAKTSYMP